MTKASRVWIAALAAAIATPIVTANAQFPPAPEPQFPEQLVDEPPAQGQPKGKGKAAAPKAASGGPAVAGTWSGNVTQLGSESAYPFSITITAAGGETSYSGLQCKGKLTRIGSSRSYVFFIEVISEGRADKGGRCPDGTITVGRAGNQLALGWFGAIQNQAVIAQGLLDKK
jgi:hypothetical protein